MKKIIIEIFVVIFILLNLPVCRVLSISDRKNPSEKIYSRDALEGFVVSYTHSVNKGRIHDYYTTTEEGRIRLIRSVVVSYGAGIPEPEEIAGCTFKILEDGYELGGIDLEMERFLLAVGVVAEHSVLCCSRKQALSGDFSEISSSKNEFFLKDFFMPRTSVVFEVKRISVISYLKSINKFK